MKSAALTILLALALCPACLAQADQQEVKHHGMMHARDAQHPLSDTAKLTASNNAAANELTLRVGPVSLPPHTDHMTAAQPPVLFFTILFDGWLTAFHPRLANARGRPLPNKLLHHAAFYNTERTDFLCSNKEEHIFGAGGEMNDWPAVPGFGYPVKKGDRIRISAMFANPTAKNYSDAFFEVQIDYQTLSSVADTAENTAAHARSNRRANEKINGKTSAIESFSSAVADPHVKPALKDVYPAWFDVMGCGNSGYDLPPGQSTKTGQFKLHFSGRLLGVGGHLHDYGEWLVLKDAATNETVATLAAHLDPSGHMLSMPVVLFIDRGGFVLRQGDVLAVTDAYNNPTGKSLPDAAMGIVVAYFLPDDPAAFGSLRHPPHH
ncbi:MAG: hypothetical protein ACRD4H_01745 [Candidatus Acidiferrales bacterium]